MKKHRKLELRARTGRSIRQVGTLPYRRSADGQAEFLLVTSRETGRFIIPKGWPMKGKSDVEAAAEEAWEEAGVVGEPDADILGRFTYWKRLKSSFVPVNVDVYLLEVATAFAEWKEQNTRQRAWLTADQAARLVDEPELVSLIKEARDLLKA
jgi:8-oxo-dGTP pyrophosphatase MutT (NUDIX family)